MEQASKRQSDLKRSITFLILAALAVASGTILSDRATAADNGIFVSNEWSRFTNEDPAPEGYVTTDTVYARFDDGGSFPPDSDLVKVTVKDPNFNILSNIQHTSIDVGSAGSGTNVFTTQSGGNELIYLTGGAGNTPITGSNDSIQIFNGGVDLIADGTLSVVARFDGDATNDPWISVVRNTGVNAFTVTQVTYIASAIDTTPVVVTSDLEASGVVIQAYETDLSTGVFEGYIRLVSSLDNSSSSTGPGSQNAGAIRTTSTPGFPVVFTFQDIFAVSRQTEVTVTSDDFDPADVAPVASIEVANEYSKLTTESPAPDGYTSAGTVLATFDDGVRVIKPDSDLVKIIVKDAGADVVTTVSTSSTDIAVDNDANGLDGSDDNLITILAGQTVTIFLDGQFGSPVAGYDSEISIISDGVDLVESGVLSVVEVYPGEDPWSPWIRVQRNTGASALTISGIGYESSARDQVSVAVSSDLEIAGVTVQVYETGNRTGEFHGFVRLVDGSASSAGSSGPGAESAGAIRTASGPVTVAFTDSQAITREETVSVTTEEIGSPNKSGVFAANEWSKITNESPAPGGYVSASAVYSTFSDGIRLIQTDSNMVKVIVKDSGADVASQRFVAPENIEVDDDFQGSGNGDVDNVLNAPAGQRSIIFLSGQSPFPISGSQESIRILSGGVDLVESGELTIITMYRGSVGIDPWIMLRRNFDTAPLALSGVEYETSSLEQGTVTVKSDLEPVGVTIQVDETDLSSGVFNGFVRLVSELNTSTGSTGAGAPNAGSIRTGSGPITIEYMDSEGGLKQTTVLVDAAPPVSTVISPANGSSTQNERPLFSGHIEDAVSGLDISEIYVAYDNANDPINSSPVISIFNGVLSGAAFLLPISTSGAVDGDLQFDFSQTPPVDVPNQPGTPNHIVDWVIKASDLAGNIGIVDANPIQQGIQIPTVRIDQTIPVFTSTASDHRTGIGWDGAVETEDRRFIRVVFDDQLQNVDATDFAVALDSGATVVPIGVTLLNNPDRFTNEGVVYLELADELASNETPIVFLQDTIQDIAGNATATGARTIVDGINPGLVVTTSGGSGSGAGDEGQGGLTNDEMVIDIASDEPLSSAPTVTVGVVGGSVELAGAATQTGAQQWQFQYSAPGGAITGDRYVTVVGFDLSSRATQISDSDTRTFTLDLELQTPVIEISPESSGVVTSATPDIAVDFSVNGEISSVSISELQIDGVATSVTPISTLGGTRLVYQLTTPLTAGIHTVTLPAGAATDAAGNSNVAPVEVQFEVELPAEVTITMEPDSVSLRADQTSLITVSVDDLGGAIPDTVQINLQHDDAVLSLVNPSCEGIFAGGSVSAVQRDQTDTGSWFVCTLPGGASGQSGVVATFQLRREGPGNPTLEFGTSGATGSAFFESGDLIAAVSTDTLEILPGTRITGQVTIQGVTDESVFSSIAPEVTLTPVSGDAPGPVTVPVAADGTFVFESVYDGVYDLTLDAPGTLGRQMTGLPVGFDDIALQTVELRGGIVNDDDDMVTGDDVSAVTGSFGAGPGDLNGRLDGDGDLVDFDGDGFVTGFDISIVMSNVGAQRLQEWTDPAQTP